MWVASFKWSSHLWSSMHVIRKTHLTLLNQGFNLNLKLWILFWGCIWKLGYEEGKLKGELFADSLPYFEKLISNGDKIGIYSSGSIQAQKLLLEYSQHGNIVKLFRHRLRWLHFLVMMCLVFRLWPVKSHHFDTTTAGNKREANSYKIIKNTLDIHYNVDRIVFYTGSSPDTIL